MTLQSRSVEFEKISTAFIIKIFFKRKLRALKMVEKKRGKNREDKPNRGSNKRP